MHLNVLVIQLVIVYSYVKGYDLGATYNMLTGNANVGVSIPTIVTNIDATISVINKLHALLQQNFETEIPKYDFALLNV